MKDLKRLSFSKEDCILGIIGSGIVMIIIQLFVNSNFLSELYLETLLPPPIKNLSTFDYQPNRGCLFFVTIHDVYPPLSYAILL